MNSEASMNSNMNATMNTTMDAGRNMASSNRSSLSKNTNRRESDAMILVSNSSSSNRDTAKGRGNSRAAKKALWKKRRARRASGRKKQGGGRLDGRRQSRFWQLPESSIHDYTKWIQEKPEEDRTPSEERFLWKCMIRSLGVVGNNNKSKSNNNSNPSGGKHVRQERIREFVDRLETKEPMELTENEQHFVRLYHKRRKDRKTQKQQQEKEQTVSWMRSESTTKKSQNAQNKHKGNRKILKNKKSKGLEPQASLESLRESMNRMGLSSDNLKQVRFADPPMK